MEDRFDPAKDAANRAKHRLSLAFGDRIFEDGDHLILPSLRPEDGEERFKVIGLSRNFEQPLRGFAVRDLAATL